MFNDISARLVNTQASSVIDDSSPRRVKGLCCHKAPQLGSWNLPTEKI